MQHFKNKYLLILIPILLVKAVLFYLWIPATEIGLAPDEAQYWTWSKHLDWGYYSKPPGVAWEIWLGTQFFGDTVLGVRFMSIIISAALSLATFFLAKSCNLGDKQAFWASMALTFTPIGLFSSFLATTDGGMLLFWTLACGFYFSGNPYLTGIMILCGALFKWPIYLLWIPFILYGRLNIGFFISLLGLLPSLIWNYSHDWVTFRHVFTQSTGGNSPAKANFFEFLGAQAAIFSPILFILLILAFIYFLRNKPPRPIRICGTISLSILLIFLGMSLFTKMQGNWCLFAYPTAIILMTWYVFETHKTLWLKLGIILSIILSIVVTFLPYKISPFKHSLGWENLESALIKSGYDPERHVLLGDKYQMTSLLSFYGPEQQMAYFLNLHGARKNQFYFWPRMQEGTTAFFVTTEHAPNYKDLLQKYFSRVEYVGAKTLYADKVAYIFKCTDYNGLEPIDPNLF